MEHHTTSPEIRFTSELRKNYTAIMNEIFQIKRPLFLVKKGRGRIVIMTSDEFAKYELKREKHGGKSYNELSPTLVRCSFCGQRQDEVKRIIAGPRAYICDDCIELCNEILDDEFVDDVETDNEE